MENVRATLPTLGEVDVTFHREAHEVLDFFGGTERARLDAVPQLGPAASAFTGLNHTRWEYTLLQCALIQYVGVIFKGHPHVALKGKVKLDGTSTHVSSGEELLKCWALLGNMGHAQWTYGVERGLLKAAQGDEVVRGWLIESTGIGDLRNWIRQRILAYDDMAMHYVLVLRRVRYGAAYDRRKTRFAHYVRNLVLPIGGLLPGQPDDRSKLSRLRKLYQRVRLLSLVTLDAYNSHKPLRISLQTTLNSFGQMAGVGRDAENTVAMLESVAAWLADELYLHPEAAAVQLDYEDRVAQRFPDSLRKAQKSKRGPEHLLANLFHNGMGAPWVGRYRPVLRLTFAAPRRHLLGGENLHQSWRDLRGRLCDVPATDASVDRNPFSGAVHLDLLRRKDATLGDVASLWCRATAWLLRALEADALATYRRVVPENLRTPASDAIRQQILRDRLAANTDKLQEIFESIVQHLLPPDWHAVAAPFLPSELGSRSVVMRVRSGTELIADDISPYLDRCLAANPDGLDAQRLHELKGLHRLFARATAPVVIGACEAIRIYDGFGATRDEWDAALVEIDPTEVRLHVFEGKSGGGAVHRANEAYGQLAATRDIICSHHTRHRRRRYKGLGAALSVTISGPAQP